MNSPKKKLNLIQTGIKLQTTPPEKVLITGAIPQPGKNVDPDAPLLRILTRERVLDNKLTLSGKYKRICRETYQRCLGS